MDLEKDTRCAVCDTLAKTSCSSCKATYYCSVEHQKQDWKAHKMVCPSVKTVLDFETGTEYLIMNREVIPGTILFEEAAYFHSPVWFRFGAKKQYTFDQLCIACGKEIHVTILSGPEPGMKAQERMFCLRCNWPVCSHECGDDKLHKENDCQLFQTCGIKYPPVQGGNYADFYFTNVLSMVRAMGLKKENPKQLTELLSLQYDTCCKELQKEFMLTAERNIIQLKSWIHNIPCLDIRVPEIQATSLTDEAEYKKLCGIIRLNNYLINYADVQWGPPRSTMFMYAKASLLSQSCVPNCCWSIGPAPHYKIRIRSAVPIQKGEQLTVSLIRHQSVHDYSTFVRQDLLRYRGVECTCPRCKDPTELGLFTSAIVCLRCKRSRKVSIERNLGYLLPSDPVFANKCLWKCNQCKRNVDGGEMFKRLSQYNDDLENLITELKEEDNRKKFVDMYNFLDDFATRLERRGEFLGFHRNHSKLFSSIKATVIPTLDIQNVVAVTKEISNRRKDRLLYCLAIQEKITPGLSFERALLLWSLMTVVYRPLISPEWVKNMTHKDLQTHYNLFRECSKDARKYFKNEFPEKEEDGSVNTLSVIIPNVIKSLEKLKPTGIS